MQNDFLDPNELAETGFRAVGREVKISRRAVFFGTARIEIGDFSRVDAFCVVSAGPNGIRIGRNVHISAHCTLLGTEAIAIGDFATVSVRCSIFSSNDDYSGRTMTNPTIPDAFRETTDAPVCIGAHAIIGAGSVVLPGVEIGSSSAVGALSLVRRSVAPLDIVAGVPARSIGRRSDAHLSIEVADLDRSREGRPSNIDES